MPTGPIRHREVVDSFTAGSFSATRNRRTAKPQAQSKATRDAAAHAVVKLKRMADSVVGLTTRMQDTSDNLDRLASGLRTIADQRRAIMDAAAASPGIVSATSGYVRDAAGNRIRPMTPADLNDAADRHYKRGRYAAGAALIADTAAAEPSRRVNTAAELQAINDTFWGRAR